MKARKCKPNIKKKDSPGGCEQRIFEPPNGWNIEPHYETASI